MTLSTVNKNYLQHSLALRNCQDGNYADVDNSAFELLQRLSQYISVLYR